MRPLGEYLAARGYTVSGPRLPGHGTSIEDLAQRRWPEWTDTVEEAFDELAGRCRPVFVVGLSLGSLLTIYLAANRPVDGIALLSPAIHIADPMIKLSWVAELIPMTIANKPSDSDLFDPEGDKRTWCYDAKPGRAVHQVHLFNKRVRRLLPAVTAPALVVMSRGDKSLKFDSAATVMERIGSRDKELITLERSGHNILVDGERERVWEAVAAFIGRLTGSEILSTGGVGSPETDS